MTGAAPNPHYCGDTLTADEPVPYTLTETGHEQAVVSDALDRVAELARTGIGMCEAMRHAAREQRAAMGLPWW